MFTKKTIEDYNLKGKQVILRADYNVPVEDGKITDDYRIEQSLPTIQYLLKQGCSIVIISHLGRPEVNKDLRFTLRPVAERLGKLLDKPVQFANDCIGEEASKASSELKTGQILLLENLRYYKQEQANDKQFAEQLAAHGQVFVQDGFGVVHRAHASTDAITKFLPSVAGLLLAKEVDTITTAMEKPERPMVAVVGGAKIADKIGVLNRFIEIADVLIVGGAMANTFLSAKGIRLGKSLIDKEDKPLAKEIIDKALAANKKRGFIFYVPQDAVVAKKIDKTASTRIVDWDAHVIADIESYPKKPAKSFSEINDDEMILDIGPFSGAFIAGAVQLSKTVIWNGAMGVTETPSLQGPVGPFAHGTDTLVDALLGKFGNKPYTIVGGGDTVGYIEGQGLVGSFGHVSSGGGASLDLMSGMKLPGVEALESRDKPKASKSKTTAKAKTTVKKSAKK